jgi:protein-tyrosine phosphatase
MAVSLLERDEEAQLDLTGEAAAAGASGIDFKAFAVPDRAVPASRESVAELASQILAAVEAGRCVAVHCRQSIGRSSTIAAAVLVMAGIDLDLALETIGHARGVPVPETQEQRQWLREFQAWLATRPAPRKTGHGDTETRS